MTYNVAVKNLDKQVVYPSLSDAITWLRENGWPSANASNLASGARGSGIRYGYRWLIIEEGAHSSIAVPVRCEETGYEFPSCRGAAEWLREIGKEKAASCNVSNASRYGGYAYGYHWHRTEPPK